jgi:hypothetical protein
MALLAQYFCEHWVPISRWIYLSTHLAIIEINRGSSMCIYESTLSLRPDYIYVGTKSGIVQCVMLILIIVIAIVFHFLAHNEHPY